MSNRSRFYGVPDNPLEKFVPSLASCERLRKTDFPNSVLVWHDTGMRRRTGEEAPCTLHVYSLVFREDLGDEDYQPAPMAQEIQEDLFGYTDAVFLRMTAENHGNGKVAWITTYEIDNADAAVIGSKSLVDGLLGHWLKVNPRPSPYDEEEAE